MLWLYVGTDVAILLHTRTVGAELNEGVPLPGQLPWLAVDLMLVRAITRGNRTALWVLVTLTAMPAVLMTLSLTRLTGYGAGLLAMVAIELLVLTSPAVRAHTLRARRSGGVAQHGAPPPGR